MMASTYLGYGVLDNLLANGGSVRTSGAQSYGNVTLGAATTLTSTTNGNITLGGTVNNAQTLTINTGGTSYEVSSIYER